jgi:hypothetical protein
MVFAVVNSPETAHLIDPAVREWSADTRPIGIGTCFTIRGRLGIVPIRGKSVAILSRLFRRAFAAQAGALGSYLNQRAADSPAPPL